jgi:hypothetical protein
VVSMHRPDRRTGGSALEVPVLMYHSLAPGPRRSFRQLAAGHGEFAAPMAYLDGQGYLAAGLYRPPGLTTPYRYVNPDRDEAPAS